MARIKVLNGAWTQIGPLDADTEIAVEGGIARTQTGSSAPANILDGVKRYNGDSVVVGVGETVWATAASNSAYIVSKELAQ